MMTFRVEPWDILQQLFETEKINNHVLHFYGVYAGELNLSLFQTATTALTNDFPLIRCNLRMMHNRQVWIDTGYTGQDIVSLEHTSDTEISKDHYLLQEISPENGPQLKIMILRTAAADGLCIIMNHMLCDAAGFKEILYRLASLYTALENKIEISVNSMMKDRSVGQIVKTFPLKKRLGIYLHKGKLSPRGKTEFSFEGDDNTPFIELRKIPKKQFLIIKNYARMHGASVNDIVMTACMRVLSDIFGKSDILPCAIDIRRFLSDRNTAGVCNLVTNIFCDLGPMLPDTFENTLAEVKHCMDTQKNDAGCLKNLILLELLFRIVPHGPALKFLQKVFTNPPIAFTNIGILDKQKLSFGSTDMTEGFMTGSVKYPNYFQLSLSTFDDEAVFCVNLYGTTNDRKIIASFLDSFIREMNSL